MGAPSRGQIQRSTIFTVYQLGFIGLEFDSLPIRASTIVIAAPIDCVIVINNMAREGGRRRKIPAVQTHAKSGNGRNSRGKLRNKARWKIKWIVTLGHVK